MTVEIYLVIKTIVRNKEKSFFSILGITLCVATTVAILSISSGGKLIIENDLLSIGENRIVVRGVGAKLEDLDNIEKMPFIKYSAIQGMGYEDTKNKIIIYGITNKMFFYKKIGNRLEKNDIYLEKSLAEKKHKKIGEKFEININGRKKWLNIRGIYTDKNPLRKEKNKNYAIVNFNTLKLYSTSIIKNGIVITLNKDENLKELTPLIMSQLKRINPNGKYELIEEGNQAGIIRNIKKNLSLFLSSIGGISLIIGGISISNLMTNIVKERTGYIGILMSMGANSKRIFLLFLVESGLLSIIGGFLGVIIGIIVSIIVSNIIKIPAIYSIEKILVVLIVSIIMGIVFGVIPAKKAANMNVVDAMKEV
ncbi:MAG: ABC transporter permease [Fusobacteriaceae bacterium]